MGSTDTFSGWPRIIHPEDAPPPFGPALAKLPGAEAATLVYNPEHRFDRYLSSAKVIAWWGDRVALLDAEADGALTAELSLATLARVEWGTALLTAWLALEGEGPQGHAALRVDFNTTCKFLYDPLLARLRAGRYPGDHAGWEAPRFEGLTRIDYRFASFGRMALAPGAEVQVWHREPAARLRRPGTLWWDKLPAFLLMLTQSELVVIQEGDGRRHGPYAATWTFLPLERISTATAAFPPERDRVQFCVHVRGGSDTVFAAPAAAAAALRGLLERIRLGLVEELPAAPQLAHPPHAAA